MRVLLVHQNFPGQFGHLAARWSARPGWDVRALGRESAPGLPGFDKLVRYATARAGSPGQHPYLRQMEAATLHGQATARAMLRMRREGFRPDVIVAHPGWGETLYAKDVFPTPDWFTTARYYGADGADLGFDPEFPLSFDDRARIRSWNALHALNLTNCDAAIAPTRWQKSRHPAIFHDKISVQHEGIAIDELAADPAATITTPGGVCLRAGDPVVTYVARNLEPYRGFHVFMRMLARLQQADPACHALIVGADAVSYGSRPKDARHWREKMLREVRLDPARTHFLGRLPRRQFVRVLQVSAAHVYLTYPFVLSWSLLEAMACAAPVVASDTAPVREVARDGHNARLADFFDVESLVAITRELLADPDSRRSFGKRARAEVSRYRQDAGLDGYERIAGLSQ